MYAIITYVEYKEKANRCQGNLDSYSSNKMRKTQNEHLNIVCLNLNSQ